MPPRCSGPKCKRPPFALGLCQAHYQQHLRGGPLKPLRTGPTRQVLTVRISPEARLALGESPSTKAQEIIEHWARRNPPPPTPTPTAEETTP